MPIQTIKIKSIDALDKAAEEFLRKSAPVKKFAFYGTMGAGKTTFIKAICAKLGVIDEVVSPTFAIINEYHTHNNNTLYHFDFYRINSIHEAFDFGYEDYFYSNNYCFVEWPEKIETLLSDEFLKVTIEETENQQRIITF